MYDLPIKTEYYPTQTCQKTGFLFIRPILAVFGSWSNMRIPMDSFNYFVGLSTSVKNSQPKIIRGAKTVFSVVKRKLFAKEPGRSLQTQQLRILLLGLAYNIYKLRPFLAQVHLEFGWDIKRARWLLTTPSPWAMAPPKKL